MAKEDANTLSQEGTNLQTAGIHLGTNCAHFPFTCSYSYETDFIQGLLKKNEKKLAFNFRFCNIDCIYPIEIEIKDTARSASYFDLHLKIDSDGRLRTKLYDKRDDFHFPIVTFHLYEATFQQHLHMEYISLSWSDKTVAANKEATEPRVPIG